MKRIVFFINCMTGHGAEHQLSILANLLSERGYDVCITTYGDTPDHYDLNPKIERVKLAEGKNKIEKFRSIFCYFWKLESDWLVTFDQRNNVFAMIPFLFRNKGKMKILCGERNFTIDGQQSVYEKLLVNFLYRRADWVVSNNKSQEKHIRAIAPWLNSKLRTIINHTELSHYQFCDLPHNKVLKIASFARYTAQKNCLRFAEAIKIVSEKSDIPFEVHWYGNFYIHGTELNNDYMALKNKISELKIQKYFILHDSVKDVAALMPEMDAFTLPSLYEGFSNSLAEAICCGKPIIASDVSDNSVMVHNGVNGFLFNPLEVSSIADAYIKYLKLSTEQKSKFGKSSRQIAEQLFAGDKFIKSYLEIFENK